MDKAKQQRRNLLAISAIAFLVALFIFSFIYILSLRKTSKAQKKALRAQNAASRAQMNPHFIFNALQSVRSHIREDKLEDARINLTHFAKLMRTMLEMSRSDMISLEDELGFLQAYVDVEKLIHHLPIDFAIAVDEEVELYDYKIPPMLIQPILENAIKYGGNGKEIVVRMAVSLADDLISVCIEDNGKGFGSHVPVHKSASLQILENRLMRMGRKARLTTGQSDLGGAKVEINFPEVKENRQDLF